MRFKEFEKMIKHRYCSAVDCVARDFYAPIIENATNYDRAVAYFSSAALLSLARELVPFIEHDGQIRVVVGEIVDRNDIDALRNIEDIDNQEDREIVRTRFLNTLKELNNSGEVGSIAASFLSELIVSGVLKLQFAVRKHGLFHSKFGIFKDAEGNQIAFDGSANETRSALISQANQESINVFRSWEPTWETHGIDIVNQFESLWKGNEIGTLTYTFDEVRDAGLFNELSEFAQNKSTQETIREKLLKFKDKQHWEDPKGQGLRKYQREAVDIWNSAEGKGILAMATGTGKTKTALGIITDKRQASPGALVAVVVPYQLLAEKWCDDLSEAGFSAIRVYENQKNWIDSLRIFLSVQQTGAWPVLVFVSNTFETPAVQFRLKQYLQKWGRDDSLIVFDECHHYNNPKRIDLIKGLPFKYVLGLSATPYSQFEVDPQYRHLSNYMGEIVFEYGLDKAIENHFLTPYSYDYHVVELTEEEELEYIRITGDMVRRKSVLEASGQSVTSDALFGSLSRARRAIVNNAENKLAKITELLKNKSPEPFTLFYCGAKSGENEQIKRLSVLLRKQEWRVARVTAEESKRDRLNILEAFKERDIHAVLSIKVLDEGIDIPACRTAYFLASDSNNRQWVQRRGRVLRLAKNKDESKIIDFVVVGNRDDACIKSLALKEFQRVEEFAKDSLNSFELFQTIDNDKVRIGLVNVLDEFELQSELIGD